LITDDNELLSDVSPYENQKWFTNEFVNWIEWMKENNVYDNTKIILVSDHGPSWYKYNREIKDVFPIRWTTEEKIPLKSFLRLNPLLLIKDFHSKGVMDKDWRFMCNADVHAITFNENDPTKIDSTSRTITTYYTHWHNDLHTRKKYENMFTFEVTDYIFDLKNWKEIK
jgi:arylsulfatase A-like enzyme